MAAPGQVRLFEPWKGGESELGGAVSIKYTLDFEVLVQKKPLKNKQKNKHPVTQTVKYLTSNFYMIHKLK